jgi:hypothetical protein
MQELHRDVRGIAARAAVAHGEQPATAVVDAGDGARRGEQALSLFGEEATISRDSRALSSIERISAASRRVGSGRWPPRNG